VSKPDLSRWPNLQLATHPVLDWVETTYDPATLLEMADAIRKDPHPIQTRTAAGMPAVWNPPIEALLRALADTPAALEKLNRTRPTPPRRVEGLNRAVHYLVRLELRNDRVKDALADVAKVWGASEATIKEDRTNHSVKNPREYKRDDANRLAAQIINDTAVRQSKTRAEVLKAFDADMKHRAKQLRGAKKNREK
jgi:hypothetical protein